MIEHLLEQLPALQVVLPLLAAPACVLLRRANAAWAVFLIAAWATLAISVLIMVQVSVGGLISYQLGGWAPPVGIEYRIDHLNAFVMLVVSGIAAVVAPYARTSVASEIDGDRIYLFYALLCLCLCGLLGITITGDAFNLFVFLEISSLSSYALIAMGTRRRALMAALEYLIMGTIGGTFILIGIGLLYMMTGTLNMDDLATRLPGVAGTRPVEAGLAFIVVGASLKLALVPLHAWLPNAYGFAPSVISAFLAATSTKVMAYVLIRFLYTVFGVDYGFELLPLGHILVVLAVAAMLYGSVAAIYANDLKRLLAWSSIAQIGYIVLGLALASSAGLLAAIVHLLNHAAIKGTLFLAVGLMVWRVGSSSLTHLAGIGRTMPWTGAAFALAGLALIGIPATAGFISKWYLLEAVLVEGHGWLAGAILLASLLSLIYIGRVVELLYFREPTAGAAGAAEAPRSMLASTWVLLAVTIALGLYSTPFVSYARTAAQALVEGGA